MSPWITVVGIGDDGLDGLAPSTRALVEQAEVLVGGARHLAMLGEDGREHIAWPSPFDPLTEQLLALKGRRVCVLASGDPTCYGVGSVLAQQLGMQAIRILPAPSAFSLARARLGWPVENVDCLSLHGRPLSLLQTYIRPGARLLVLSAGADTPAEVANVLRERGYGDSPMTVLSHLGGEAEQHYESTAKGFDANTAIPDLNTLAIECIADSSAPLLARTPGLADECFVHDGQLTKREVRAVTLSALQPVPGQLLWDIGAGCGSVGIEWMRCHPGCRAIAVEPNTHRLELLASNCAALGTPGLKVVAGRAPAALEDLPTPDAVFIGGGITEPDLLEHCWQRLSDGGRLVANVVSVEGESIVDEWQRQHGGALSRISVTRAEPLGRFRGWRPLMPVTQLAVTKSAPGDEA